MDICRFINSGDIREYLELLNYPFSMTEAAWLIYQCRDASIAEKHEAWNELIETMPDCPVPRNTSKDGDNSMHRFLSRYMEIQNRLTERFFAKTDGCVYQFSTMYENGTESTPDILYSSVDRYTAPEKTDLKGVRNIRCRKTQIDYSGNSITAVFDPQMRLMDVECLCFDDPDDETVYSIIWDYSFWFDFPTPFAKGDIVWIPGWYKHPRPTGPMAVFSVSLFENPDGEKPDRAYMQSYGDESYMRIYGYTIDKEDGKIRTEYVSNYMDAEKYPYELTGCNGVLQALSEMLKYKPVIPSKHHNMWSSWKELPGLKFAEDYHRILLAGPDSRGD